MASTRRLPVPDAVRYVYRPTGHGGVTNGIHDDLLESTLLDISFGRGETPDLSKPSVRAELTRDLATVIVGPMPHRSRMLRSLVALLGREPERSGGVYVWYDA